MAKTAKHNSGKRPTRSTMGPTAVPAELRTRPSRAHVVVIAAVFALAVVFGYWSTLAAMNQRWASDSNYSHAYLVPLFSLYLLWSRRGAVDWASSRSSWWGLPILLVGVAMKLAGAYIFFDWLEAISLLPVLAGAALLLAGWPAIRYAGLSIGFLAFMIPLPFRLETSLSLPLQRVATTASTYIMQTLGMPAFAEGNVIVLNSARIGVVEACNGLGMLVLFFAVATGVAILIRRPLVVKVLIIASAVPIAVAANILRITATGILHETVGGEWADKFFHDFAGWLMMPIALGLLWLELQILTRAVISIDHQEGPLRLDLSNSTNVRPPRKESAGVTV